MRKPDQSMARSMGWGRRVRLAVLGSGVLLLAGCATGYSFVQPDMAGSGGYYTGDGPYSGQGYYDYYGTGPYYPGTGGWGYYNGTWPYSGGYYGGGYYGDYGYGSSFTFNLGFSSVWGFPGYWGPWYSTGFPIWSCAGRGCGGWHHHGHHDRHDHGNQDSPRPWLKPDHPPIPPRIARDGTPIAVPSRPLVRRPVEGFANRRALESATYAPHEFVRPAVRRPAEAGFNSMPMNRPTRVLLVPTEPAFANRGSLPAPVAAPRPAPSPVFRPQPTHAAPVAAPPQRAAPQRARATKTEIP